MVEVQNEEPVLSVSEAIKLINFAFTQTIPWLKVEGEVSGYSVSQGKWLFFSLNDAASSVKCFMPLHNLDVALEDGMKIKVLARPNLHHRNGFSLTIEQLSLSGEGSLLKAFELTKKKLAADGLFDESRKRAVGAYPEKLALITSETAAAYTDVLHILGVRWPLSEVVFKSAVVQGDSAVESIITAINVVNQLEDLPDALLIVRGGGSLEDLAAFNSEKLARAIAASRVPTIVGVGHERDVTLVEMVADIAATTPTNAATLATPDMNEIILGLQNVEPDLRAAYLQNIELRASEVSQAVLRLGAGLERLASWLKLVTAKLTNYDPQQVLAQGYALVRMNDKLITRAASLQTDDIITLKFSDGTVNSKVQGK